MKRETSSLSPPSDALIGAKYEKFYKMNLSLSCLVTLPKIKENL